MLPWVVLWLAAAAPDAAVGQGARPAALVRVAAAADLKFALEEVIARFREQRPDARVEPTYGSSGTIHAQLRQRAPYDVYLSADIAYPQDLVSRGIGAPGDLFAYARGRLVLWVPLASALPIERDGLGALAGARRIAIANPRHAPYGRAAEAAMRRVGIWAVAERRLVLAENVAQAAQFVQSGAADAGVIAKSLAFAGPMRASGRYREIPEDMHPPIEQGGLILPWASSPAAAREFRQYLTGIEGRRILERFGFAAPSR
jgi:molybdate transport system substrate-binding protein